MEDYTKFSKNKKSEVLAEDVVEVDDTPVVEETSIKTGCVYGCSKLNVRSAASSESEVVCVISENTKIAVDESESTSDFYKICTVSGIEGYCMKQYITLE